MKVNLIKINYAVVTVFAANLLAITADISMTWTSPILPKLLSNDSDVNPLGRAITPNEESWIGSLMTLGAILGPLPAGFAADYFGRKYTLLFLALPHIVAYLVLAFAKTIGLYYFARILSGFSVGAVYALLPVYIGEVAEDSNRGMLLSYMNVFTTIGNVIPYAIGPYLPILLFNLILVSIPTLFVVVFYILAPESPYLLMANQDMGGAESSLRRLRTKSLKGVQEELQKIKQSVECDQKGRLQDLFRTKGGRKAFLISTTLIAFQQFTGINAIMFYTEMIFEATGSKIPADIAATIVGVVQFVASFVTPMVVDKYGRRPLLIISAIGMFFSLGLLGLFYYLQKETSYDVNKIYWLPVISLVGYISTFNVGFGPIPWCITGEIFPSNVRSVAASATSSVCWLCSFWTTKYFIALTKEIGDYGCFWIFSGVSLLAIVFVVFCVPETKEKSFQEIKSLFS